MNPVPALPFAHHIDFHTTVTTPSLWTTVPSAIVLITHTQLWPMRHTLLAFDFLVLIAEYCSAFISVITLRSRTSSIPRRCPCVPTTGPIHRPTEGPFGSANNHDRHDEVCPIPKVLTQMSTFTGPSEWRILPGTNWWTFGPPMILCADSLHEEDTSVWTPERVV